MHHSCAPPLAAVTWMNYPHCCGGIVICSRNPPEFSNPLPGYGNHISCLRDSEVMCILGRADWNLITWVHVKVLSDLKVPTGVAQMLNPPLEGGTSVCWCHPWVAFAFYYNLLWSDDSKTFVQMIKEHNNNSRQFNCNVMPLLPSSPSAAALFHFF